MQANSTRQEGSGRTAALRLLAAVLLLTSAARRPARADGMIATLTIRAAHACHNTPVTVAFPPEKYRRFLIHPAFELVLQSTDKKETLPCQMESSGNRILLTFLLHDLAAGAKRTYEIHQIVVTTKGTANSVFVKQAGDDLNIEVEGKPFTRYVTHSGPNKPFFYPILTPDGANFTRRWPVTPNDDDSKDHPHHRGLWFTHGSVNGTDFWTEEGRVGKTVNIGYGTPVNGAVWSGFRANTDWRDPDGKLIASDTRDVRIYALPDGDRLLDFAITITPVGGPLVFGDTKEGMFGLRVADSLCPNATDPKKNKTGHIESSDGHKDGAVWGRPADWVDYYGPLGNAIYGVAIFDDPQNLRHPQTWHARDYGLFAVNPFGLHDFGRGEKGAGNYTVPADKTLALRYRLLFHKGDPTTARIADQYAAYADPPQVEIR